MFSSYDDLKTPALLDGKSLTNSPWPTSAGLKTPLLAGPASPWSRHPCCAASWPSYCPGTPLSSWCWCWPGPASTWSCCPSCTTSWVAADQAQPALGHHATLAVQLLDPVFHLDLLFRRTQAPPDYPAFSYRTPSGNLSFVSHKVFTQRLKKLLSQSGFTPEKFSGHSLRRGGATYLYQCGASVLEIQACTLSSCVF